MKKKVQIHQFDPVIYPRNVWIVIGDIAPDTITERFRVSKSLMRDIEDNGYKCNGVTIKVVELSTMSQGMLVILKRKTATAGVVAHESVHVADYIFEEIGAYTQDYKYLNEPYAYLVGWVADCIDKVLKNKA